MFSKSLNLPADLKFERKTDATLGVKSRGSEVGSCHLPLGVKVKFGEETLEISSESKMMLNTTYANLKNWLTGHREAFVKEFELVGIGYSVSEIEPSLLNFKLSFNHPVLYRVNPVVKVRILGSRKLVLTSVDKQSLGQVGAEIGRIKRPNPYFPNGIYEVGRTYIKRKSKKG